MPVKTYEKCKINTIKKIIKIYEKDKSKKSPSKKQSIAIALSIAEKGCKNKLSKDDIIKKEAKINSFLESKENIVKLSVITDYRLVYDYYIKKKKYLNAIKLQNNFMKKVLMMEHKNKLPISAYKALMKK
jgi:hypothetical protein